MNRELDLQHFVTRQPRQMATFHRCATGQRLMAAFALSLCVALVCPAHAEGVPVPVVVLGGIAGLLEELERLAGEAGEQGNVQAAQETLAYLRTISG
ncbi:hypothetical protein AB0901_09130 [Streptomyces roseifaciens]